MTRVYRKNEKPSIRIFICWNGFPSSNDQFNTIHGNPKLWHQLLQTLKWHETY